MTQTFYKLIFTILSPTSYALFPPYKNYLKKLTIITKKNIVFGGDLVFDSKFVASGGNPILKVIENL